MGRARGARERERLPTEAARLDGTTSEVGCECPRLGQTRTEFTQTERGKWRHGRSSRFSRKGGFKILSYLVPIPLPPHGPFLRSTALP